MILLMWETQWRKANPWTHIAELNILDKEGMVSKGLLWRKLGTFVVGIVLYHRVWKKYKIELLKHMTL